MECFAQNSGTKIKRVWIIKKSANVNDKHANLIDFGIVEKMKMDKFFNKKLLTWKQRDQK